MLSSNPLFAICIKQDEIIKQNGGTKHAIVPGDLIKIMPMENTKSSDDPYVIQTYNRNNKGFDQNILYLCDKANLKLVDEHVISFVKELNKDDKITLNLEVCGSKANVVACIKRIGDVRNLGAGRFFAFELIDTSNFTEDQKSHIQEYNTDPSGLCFIRGDRLIDCLITRRLTKINSIEPNIMEVENQLPSISDPDANYSLLTPSIIANAQPRTVSEIPVINLQSNVTPNNQNSSLPMHKYSNVMAQMKNNQIKESNESQPADDSIDSEVMRNTFESTTTSLDETDKNPAIEINDKTEANASTSNSESGEAFSVHKQHECDGFVEIKGVKSVCPDCAIVEMKLLS